MPQQLTSGELIANISSELADNNAGLISAYDVRHNMEDMAFFINKIVSSGDHDVQYPFYNPVRASKEKVITKDKLPLILRNNKAKFIPKINYIKSSDFDKNEMLEDQ